MRVSDQAARIAYWLRFEHGQPVFKPIIEQALGIVLTPGLIREGDVTGLFRFGPKGFF